MVNENLEHRLSRIEKALGLNEESIDPDDVDLAGLIDLQLERYGCKLSLEEVVQAVGELPSAEDIVTRNEGWAEEAATSYADRHQDDGR